MEFTRAQVKMLTEEMYQALEPIAKRMGLEMNRQTVHYDSNGVTLKAKFMNPISVVPTQTATDNTELSWGMATRGTKALLRNEVVTIHEARRKKYVFSFDSNPDKKYIANFTAFKPMEA